MTGIHTITQRLIRITAVLLLALWQVVFALSPLMLSTHAYAAPNCTNDVQGVDDEPGQKDLTRMCVDAQATPTISWQWDDTAWSGSNTGDGCALFDNDNNGFVDYAVCVTVGGDPATQQSNSPRVYSCGDTRPENCTSATLVPGPYTTTCTVNTNGDDPFNATTDTLASCAVTLTEVGSGTLLDVCSYPSQQPNSDFSDCIIFKAKSAKIEVRKVLSPVGDGLFDLKINGTTYANDVGNGGTTGEIVVPDGTVTVLEAENSPTDLANYDTSVVCRDLNGTGSIVGQATPTGADTRQLSITAPDGSDIVCTFTNTRKSGTVRVVKDVINDNGGTKTYADFTFQNNGGTAQTFTATTSPDGERVLSLPVGSSFAITEVQENSAGYLTSYSANCSGTVTVTEQVCTITNNDQPGTLIVKKVIVNDNGGTKTADNFSYKVNGGSSVSFEADGENQATVNSGIYTIVEDADSGYTTSYDNCSQVVVPNGGTATCTITNNDKPATLIVNKVLTQDNGGTDLITNFSYSINNGTPVAFESDGSNSQLVSAGTYNVTETPNSAYTTTYNNCSNIQLTNGQSATCTITNDDIAPKLTVTKIVQNDNGGTLQVSDFTLYVGTVQVVSGEQNEFSQDTVVVSEAPTDGYTGVISGDCNPDTGAITMAIGGVYSCTITNNDQPGTLIVKKVIVNDNGGTKTADNFSYKVNGGSSVSFEADGENQATVNSGIYTIVEDADSGYTTSYDNCSQVVVPNGGTATCTITNNDKPATLIVNKTIVADDGSTKTYSDFSFAISGSASVPSQQFDDDGSVSNSLNAGTYSVTEDNAPGFTTTYSTDCTNVVLQNGETKTCTITNDDIAPKLTLHKVVVSANQARSASDWTLSATPLVGTTLSGNGEDGFEDKTAVANLTYTLDETGPAGTYDASKWDCAGDFTHPNNESDKIRLSEGADVTCTITNTERGSITIIKDAQPDSSQAFKFTGDLGDPSDEDGPNFTLVDDGQNDTTDRRTFASLSSGTYTVTEPNVKGWTLESITCEGGSDASAHERNAVIKLAPGENVTCTFVNTRDTGHIIVDKVTNPAGSTQSFDFTTTGEGYTSFSLTDAAEPNDQTVVTGSYSVAETTVTGWDNTGAVCDGEQSPDSITVEKGQTVHCTFTNTQRSTVTVTKYNDLDRDGTPTSQVNGQTVQDPTLPDWEITLSGFDNQTTGTDGSTTFANVKSGRYLLDEILKDGWTQRNIHCNDLDQEVGEVVSEDGYVVSVEPGANVECFIGNFQALALNLAKTNNRPAPTVVGDTVTYTLTASLPTTSGASFNSFVSDLPPEGFVYVPGSWTASVKHLDGTTQDLKENGTTPEPGYGSPGTWLLGTLLPGDIVTLTYRATIQNSVNAGTYPDLAFASGCDLPTAACSGGTVVYSNIASGANDPFVGTNVTVTVPQVLGASTTRTILVNTGTETTLIQIFAGLIMALALALAMRTHYSAKGGRS